MRGRRVRPRRLPRGPSPRAPAALSAVLTLGGARPRLSGRAREPRAEGGRTEGRPGRLGAFRPFQDLGVCPRLEQRGRYPDPFRRRWERRRVRGNRKSLPPLAAGAGAGARPSQAPPSGREEGVQTKAPGRPRTPGKEDEAPRLIACCINAVGPRPSRCVPADLDSDFLPVPPGRVRQLPGATPGVGRCPISPHTCEVMRLKHLAQRSSEPSGQVGPLLAHLPDPPRCPAAGPSLAQGPRLSQAPLRDQQAPVRC